jgi:hypothetical protein
MYLLRRYCHGVELLAVTDRSIHPHQPVKLLRLSRELTEQVVTKPEFELTDAI